MDSFNTDKKDYLELDLRKSLYVLLARKRLIFGVVILAVIVSGLVSFFLLPPVYEARVSMVVVQENPQTDYKEPQKGSLESIIDYAIKLPGLTINTYVEQIKDPKLLSKVIEDLDLAKQGYTIKGLSRMIDVTPVKETTLIQIAVENRSQTLAVDITNSLCDQLKKSISENSQKKMAESLEFLTAQATNVSLELETQRNKLAKLEQANAGSTGEPNDLKNSIGQLESTNQLLSEKIIQAQIGKSIDYGSINLQTTAATLIDEPVKPKKQLIILLTGILFLLGSMAVVLIGESINKKIRSREDVERNLSLPVLASIPLLKAKHLKTSEAFKILRTNLQYLVAKSDDKLLMMAGCGLGEGTSTMLSNLAINLAQIGRKVLLVDANFRTPTQHETFRITNNIGLSNLLVENLDPKHVIVDTFENGLSVLPSGPLPPNPTELLAGSRTEQLMADLKAQFDYVLLDSPGVSVVTDACLLAAKVDGAVLVAKHGKTNIELAQEAKDELARSGVKILGVIVNGMNSKGG